MPYDLYASVDELLDPETLTELTGQPVNYVHCSPMQGGMSGSQLLTVTANVGAATGSYILKRMSRQWDWIMDSSNDHRCRSITLWQSLLLKRLEPTVRNPIFACARDGDDWALLMHDVSAALLVDQEPFTVEQVYCLLDTLATLHVTFWDAPQLADPELGLCTSMDLIQSFSPLAAQRYLSASSPLPKIVVEGWPLLQEFVAPQVIDVMSQLFADPQPLCAALARYPATLLHGDYRCMNLGIACEDGPQVVIIDWQLATHSVATIDLAWFLYMPHLLRSPVSPEAATEYYRQRLAEKLGVRFDNSWWQPMLALGKLVNVLRIACIRAYVAADPTNKAEQALFRNVLPIFGQEVIDALPWL